MKNHKLLTGTLLLLLGVTFFLTSCGEDEDEITLIGSWKVTGATFNPPIDTNGSTSGGTVTDAYPLMFPQTCDQDNLFIFEEGAVFKDDEGAVKCDTSSAQYEQGTYTQSGSTITIVTGDTILLTNSAITKTTLTGTVTVDFGVSATIDFTMTRQ